MLLTAVCLCSVVAFENSGRASELPAAVDVGRFHLRSNLWVSLHERLDQEARYGAPSPRRLTGDSLVAWTKAVTDYRAFLGNRSPIEDGDLIRLIATLSATRTLALPDSLQEAALRPLRAAMPLYQAVQWDEDDRANRFWMAVAKPMLESAGEELAEAHARVYDMPFPRHIWVDVAPFGWQFGAYTVGQEDSSRTVMTSTVAGYQGFASLEMLMHEASHVIVGDRSGAIGSDLAKASKELGIRPYSNLWHAILFYTSGELTRRALAERGVSDYQPVILGMYTRGYRGYRQALETHWQAYLDGKSTREAAIRQILIETAPPKQP